jgi:hypothetical protein
MTTRCRRQSWGWVLACLVAFVAIAIDAAPLQAVRLTPAQKCTASKLKAAGNKALAKVRCNAQAIVNPNCLVRAETRFTKAFQRAEAKGGCLTTADAATIETLVDAFVGNVILAVGPPAPTPSPTATGTLPTATPTPTATSTRTVTTPPTATPTKTSSPTVTGTLPTSTATPTSTTTRTATATVTGTPPTSTVTATSTATPTATPSSTATQTATGTPATLTPTPTESTTATPATPTQTP